MYTSCFSAPPNSRVPARNATRSGSGSSPTGGRVRTALCDAYGVTVDEHSRNRPPGTIGRRGTGSPTLRLRVEPRLEHQHGPEHGAPAVRPPSLTLPGVRDHGSIQEPLSLELRRSQEVAGPLAQWPGQP